MVTSCQCDLRSADPSTFTRKNGISNVPVPYVHERPWCLDLEKNKLERGHQARASVKKTAKDQPHLYTRGKVSSFEWMKRFFQVLAVEGSTTIVYSALF